MSLEYPIQTRAIDPYSSYNSNIVNRLTRLITRGENCLHGTHAIDVYLDSTAVNTVTIIPGQCFKDDVIITITEEMTIDVSYEDYYINHQSPWNEAGYYWLCLEYVYAKSKPAPQARIRILKPSQHHLFSESGAFLFLKAFEVTFDGTVFHLGDLYDYDPNVPEMKRIYAQLIAGVEDNLQSFDQTRDEGRIIYVRSEDELFFGTSERWESFNAIRANVDTTLCSVGQIAYLDIDGKVHPAIATDYLTLGDCGVIQVGEALNGDGKVRLYGTLRNVIIEPGRSIEEGENVYLSASVPGAVTDLMPGMFAQFIGTCISPATSTTTCDIWFLPNQTRSGGGGGQSWQDPYQDLLLGSIYTNLHVDQLSNLDFIDTTATTAILITYDFRIDGNSGDEFVTIDVSENGWASPIPSCQVSAEYEGDITWFVNNSNVDELAWEETELNKRHIFSEVVLVLNNITGGPFTLGERVDSSSSLKSGIVNKFDSGRLYVSLVNKKAESWLVGETITGFVSGATGIVESIENREYNSSIRLKAIFGSAGGSIYDYGIIYNEDEDLLSDARNHENNIDTLYLDVYTTPHQDDDGNPNLSVPLETQIANLSNDLTLCCDNTNNNIQTLFSDVYISPSIDDDGNPNLTTPLEGQLVVTNTRIDDLIVVVNNINTSLGSDLTEVNNDIDTLYADTYISPHRDNDGNPNLTLPLEAQIELRRLEQFGTAIFVDGDPTPSVRSSATYTHQQKLWFFNNTVPTTISNFINGIPGQEIDIVFNTTSAITIKHNSNIKLQGGVDFISSSQYDMLTLIFTGVVWIEKSRSLNS